MMSFRLCTKEYLFVNKDFFKEIEWEESIFQNSHHKLTALVLCCEAAVGNYSFEMSTVGSN